MNLTFVPFEQCFYSILKNMVICYKQPNILKSNNLNKVRFFLMIIDVLFIIFEMVYFNNE